jgi:hypothetical protein
MAYETGVFDDEINEFCVFDHKVEVHFQNVMFLRCGHFVKIFL